MWYFIMDYLKLLVEEIHSVVVATVDETGHPHIAVMDMMWEDGKKVYFCTENNKAVYRQIKENSNVSFCSHKADFSYVLSISGKATFVNDINLKARALDEYPALKEMFKTPNNPILELFYVDVEEVDTFDFANGSKKEKI